VREDLSVQHYQQSFAVLLTNRQGENRETIVLESSTVCYKGEKGWEVFLALLRIQLVDKFGF